MKWFVLVLKLLYQSADLYLGIKLTETVIRSTSIRKDMKMRTTGSIQWKGESARFVFQCSYCKRVGSLCLPDCSPYLPNSPNLLSLFTWEILYGISCTESYHMESTLHASSHLSFIFLQEYNTAVKRCIVLQTDWCEYIASWWWFSVCADWYARSFYK